MLYGCSVVRGVVKNSEGEGEGEGEGEFSTTSTVVYNTQGTQCCLQVPASLVEKCQAVVAAGGLPLLEKLVQVITALCTPVIALRSSLMFGLQELPDLLQRNTDLLNESERMLR